MSFQAEQWVIENSKHKGPEFLVLWMIAYHANASGESWPSIATLVKETRLSRRSVQYAVARLVASGELLINKTEAPHKPRTYSLGVHDMHGASHAEVQTVRSRGANHALEGCKPRHRNKEELTKATDMNEHDRVLQEQFAKQEREAGIEIAKRRGFASDDNWITCYNPRIAGSLRH